MGDMVEITSPAPDSSDAATGDQTSDASQDGESEGTYPETEEERVERIRKEKYPLDPELQKKLREVFPLLLRRGQKKKTELHETEVGTMLRALGINPTEAQIEAVKDLARSKEAATTSRQHFDYENVEQRVAEFLFREPSALIRPPKEKIMEAFKILFGDGNEITPDALKKVMMTRGNTFTEQEAHAMLRAATDRDTGVVYVEEYATLLANDGMPPPSDPYEACDLSDVVKL